MFNFDHLEMPIPFAEMSSQISCQIYDVVIIWKLNGARWRIVSTYNMEITTNTRCKYGHKQNYLAYPEPFTLMGVTMVFISSLSNTAK